jgi:hypothetical protein
MARQAVPQLQNLTTRDAARELQKDEARDIADQLGTARRQDDLGSPSAGMAATDALPAAPHARARLTRDASSRELARDDSWDVFLSYAWGEQDVASGTRPLQAKAHGVARALEAEGYSVWLDAHRMTQTTVKTHGGLSDAMAFAITTSEAVVVCFSRDYARSANCKSELVFAAQLGKPLFFVNVGAPPGSADGGAAGYTPTSYNERPDAREAARVEAWLLWRIQDALWSDCRDADRAAGAGGVANLLKAMRAARVPQSGSRAAGPPGVSAPPARRGLPRRGSSLFAAALETEAHGSGGGVAAHRVRSGTVESRVAAASSGSTAQGGAGAAADSGAGLRGVALAESAARQVSTEDAVGHARVGTVGPCACLLPSTTDDSLDGADWDSSSLLQVGATWSLFDALRKLSNAAGAAAALLKDVETACRHVAAHSSLASAEKIESLVRGSSGGGPPALVAAGVARQCSWA